MEITMVIGIVSCVVGVCTFVSGLVARSKAEGQTFEKINQCIKGIEEIKSDLKENTVCYNNLHIVTTELEGRLRACEEDIKALAKRVNKED